jgi:acyl carrier protein
LLQQLSEAAGSERQHLLISHLQGLVARVLQLDASQFSPQESLTSLGLDSMLAIEIKHRVEASLKIEISVLELLKEVTIAQLADRILSSLPFEGEPIGSSNAVSLTEIQQLVENADGEDLESLLAELEQTPEQDLEKTLAELQNEDLESLLNELEQSLDREANI